MRHLLLFSVLVVWCGVFVYSHPKDDDFAEFEDDEEFETDVFEDGDSEDDDVSVEGEFDEEVEEDDFETDEDLDDSGVIEEDDDVEVETIDTEEFEDYTSGSSDDRKSDIKISESAVAQYSTWHWYYAEILMLLGLVCYLLNYIMGRTRNQSLAVAWLEAHLELLKANFTIVGDNGEGDSATEEELIKQSDNSYVLWSSGRQGCNSMIIQMKLQKRHDLLFLLMNAVRPNPDTFVVSVQLADHDMDNFVLAVSKKKSAVKMMKELSDIQNYCPERRSADKFNLPSSFVVLPEIHEAAMAILSHNTISSVFQRYEELIETLHISDQYTGVVDDMAEDDSGGVVVKIPERKIIFTYTAPRAARHGNMKSVEPLLRFLLQLIDRINKYRLSKEGRDKATKNRQRVAQNVQKLSHQQRQEAAQVRKEERKKAEKEKLLQETDPDKTRKWEEKEHKRALKKQSRVKQKLMRVG
ncbi:PAT complex subunit CCDC47-like [Dysidea avara]|uniref:PAT complex subunit CCDC47-like n=1 Tax=Dysidea avara TaxID=196820 RepID=UPI0033207216